MIHFKWRSGKDNQVMRFMMNLVIYTIITIPTTNIKRIRLLHSHTRRINMLKMNIKTLINSPINMTLTSPKRNIIKIKQSPHFLHLRNQLKTTKKTNGFHLQQSSIRSIRFGRRAIPMQRNSVFLSISTARNWWANQAEAFTVNTPIALT